MNAYTVVRFLHISNILMRVWSVWSTSAVSSLFVWFGSGAVRHESFFYWVPGIVYAITIAVVIAERTMHKRIVLLTPVNSSCLSSTTYRENFAFAVQPSTDITYFQFNKPSLLIQTIWKIRKFYLCWLLLKNTFNWRQCQCFRTRNQNVN